MGYISKDIAVITEPKRVTLAALPNFVQFASKPAAKTFLELNLTVKVKSLNDIGNLSPMGSSTTKVFTAGATHSGEFIGVVTPVDYAPNITVRFKASAPISGVLYWQAVWPNYISPDAPTIWEDGGDGWYYFEANLVASAGVPAGSLFLSITNSTVLTQDITVTMDYVGATFAGGSPVDTAALRVATPSGAVYTFNPTEDPKEVSGSTFFLSPTTAETAGNLHSALMANDWIAANYDISVPANWESGAPVNGSIISIKSKGAGTDYNVQITAPDDPTTAAYTFNWVHSSSVNNDSISGESSTTEVELDVYTGGAVFLGADDKPTTAAKLGTFATALNKTYAGAPVWFDLNALFNRYAGYNRPTGAYGWFDTGTASVYRFVAKIKGVTSFAFYYSNALWALNGYGPLTDNVDLADYVYLDSAIKLLTNKPRTTYLRGQKEYLNFLFEDPQRDAVTPVNFTLRVAYRAYTMGGKYLGTIYAHDVARASLNVVNTCALNIDAVLDVYPNAGEIKVALARGTALVSNDLEYVVRPECLHTLRAFTFLNRLGGWDTFNFDAPIQDEIKPTSDTFNRTITPGFSRGDSAETVYATGLDNTLTVEGAPVSDDVADWLKELAAARVILDGEGNYVVKEDFTLRKTAAAFNMQIPTIKYHLSETYTND
jgi:hypothetical protein